jgi:hypothetical protein
MHVCTIAHPALHLTPSSVERGKGPNADIAEFLNELAEFEKNVSRVIYKYNVYRKASRAISALDTRLKSGAEAQKIPGVGKKIGEKIDEFLSTGTNEKDKDITSTTGQRHTGLAWPFHCVCGPKISSPLPLSVKANSQSWKKSKAMKITRPFKRKAPLCLCSSLCTTPIKHQRCYLLHSCRYSARPSAGLHPWWALGRSQHSATSPKCVTFVVCRIDRVTCARVVLIL